MMTIESRLL